MSGPEDSYRHPEGAEISALDTEKLTWAVLLSRWTQFAQSALALPDNAAGRQLRDSVPDLIALQAVWFALQHLDDLSHPERALGIARASVLIEKHRLALAKRWDGCVPAEILDLIHDAEAQLKIVSETHVPNE